MSLNTVAVRLGSRSGRRTWCAPRIGSASPPSSTPIASIALGTSEVSLTELVGAYAPFANGGQGVSPHVVTQDPHHGRQQGALCAPARAARPGDRAAPCRDDEHHDAGDADSAAPRARPKFPAGPPPARPAPARISATPGSSATPPISSPASGSAMTTTRRPRRRPAAACRWKSGPASCATAHQGVPVAALPNSQRRGGFLSNFVPDSRAGTVSNARAARSPPPERVQARWPAAAADAAADGRGLIVQPTRRRASAPPPNPNRTAGSRALGLDGWLVRPAVRGRR